MLQLGKAKFISSMPLASIAVLQASILCTWHNEIHNGSLQKKSMKILKMPRLNYSLKKILFTQVEWLLNKVNLSVNNLFLKSGLEYACNQEFDWFLSLKDSLTENKLVMNWI